MPEVPPRLAELIDGLELVPDRQDRIQVLIDLADRFRPVDARVATRPFPDEHKTPACESEVFVWATERDDETLDYHFAVENPQGISAMALAVILGESLSGADLDQVAGLDGEIVYRIFGRELSMGKSLGLIGMVAMVSRYARSRLDQSRRSSSITDRSSMK